MAQNLVTGKSTVAGTVTVYWRRSSNKPIINKRDGSTPASNPITAANDGSYAFWIDDGHYDIINGTPTGDLELRLRTSPGGRPTQLDAQSIAITPYRGITATNLETWLEDDANNELNYGKTLALINGWALP